MTIRTLALAAMILSGTAFAADPAPTPNDVDVVTRQAAALEAKLARESSTSAAGAEVMLQLIDLYHANARPFGLVQVAQSFVTLHSGHPRHKEVMLKLMDGLTVVGRNKELIAVGRQFLARNPSDPAAAEIEEWLARLVRKANDNAGAAAIEEAHWRRLGTTPEGVHAAREALALHLAANNPVATANAALLAEDMLNKLPAGGLATIAGWTAVEAHERRGDWPKTNLAANKLLQKSPPTNSYYLQLLHLRMADNYNRLGQRANCIASLKKALAIANTPPRPDLHARLIGEVHRAGAKASEIEPLVAEYRSKFPERTDGAGLRTLVGIAYAAEKDTAKAEQVFLEVMPQDTRSYNAAGQYLALLGQDKDRLAKAEQVLRDAIAKSTNTDNAAALRYALAIDLLRDRIKDTAKAKTAARELVFTHPSGDPIVAAAATWLLDSAADEAEFKADVAKILEARKQKPWLASLRTVIGNWIRSKTGTKEVASRIKHLRDELSKADGESPVVQWLALDRAVADGAFGNVVTARSRLLQAEKLAAYPDTVVQELFTPHYHQLRNAGSGQRFESPLSMAKRWSERLPKSPDAVAAYLGAATDAGTVAEFPNAVKATLKLEPTGNVDVARRVIQAAGGAKDAALLKQAWAWVKKGFEKAPYDNAYATTMGDVLAAGSLNAEARECWERSVAQGNPDSGDFRESAWRLLAAAAEAEKPKFLDRMLARDSAWRFSFAVAKADRLVKARELDAAAKLLMEAVDRQRQRPFAPTNVVDGEWGTFSGWIGQFRGDAKATAAEKRKVFTLVRDLGVLRASMAATVALLELAEEGDKTPPMARLVKLGRATQLGYSDVTDFELLMPYAHAAMGRKDYAAAAALASGVIANVTNIDDGRRKAVRELLTQAYTRIGASGGAVIDENSPIAPLLQAALQLRLGDSKLAFDTYLAHQKLFDEHRTDVPVDLLLFVCENHIAAGGDENHNRVEDTLRSWLIKNSESREIDAVDKARVQLLLAKNYFRSRRFDLARAEFTTLLNRYKNTPQAVEAEFGIGETFMEQKVFDQAEQAFEKLAGRREQDIVIRAEFLRGVLASRRGNRDEARAIFRAVLERVPNAELANQALFNLSEVYGAEQRYVDQLELLRTIGRLGRASKRWHTPGEALSIVVQDSDLGISRGQSRIPVRVTTEPGGDEETVYLLSGGAGKGLFRADLETALGTVVKGDRVLQVTGRDVIRVDYPEEFKKEFKDVHLPDAEIRIAADGKLDMASSKITDEKNESFSKRLEREAAGEETSKSLARPKDQIRPGNLIYLRVKDADRDVSDQPDKVQVKLLAASGDQVTAVLTETGPHTGVFEATVNTGELPAGAQATNTAIDHSPLMAIDKDPKTVWLSEPDGATPKLLSVDMKDLKRVDRVSVWTPDAKQHAPVRMTIEGSSDGKVWHRLATSPGEKPAAAVAWEAGPMTAHVFDGPKVNGITTWDQIVALSKSGSTSESKVTELAWTKPPEAKKEKPRKQSAVIWHGKLVMPRAGAARFAVTGETTAMAIDGRLELAPANGNRSVDVYLEAGAHVLTIFAAGTSVEAKWGQGDAADSPTSFHAVDFDLSLPEAKPTAVRALGEGAKNADGTSWEFKFPAAEVRFVRVNVHEYLGDAVAINHMEIADTEKKVLHLPTDADLLSLATNDVLEIAGGDSVTATYSDEATVAGSSRVLSAKLAATYYNGSINPIAYSFKKNAGGVTATPKSLLRVDPGERIVIEVTDFDHDTTTERDKIGVSVVVNDGSPIEMEAVETTAHSGIFTKEVDTAAAPAPGKIAVKPGDRVYLRYIDRQNTVPGHATVREAVVYVNQPTIGQVRIVETRAERPRGMLADAPPRPAYLPPRSDADPAKPVGVALEVPFTVEVIDPDSAKTSDSTVTVTLTTTDGAKVDVECVLSERHLTQTEQGGKGARSGRNAKAGGRGTHHANPALEEGRFTGQVLMQLGGKDSPTELPLTVTSHRNLIGGPKKTPATEMEKPKDEKPDDKKEEKKDEAEEGESTAARVLNLSGSDIVTATYQDKRRPEGGEVALTAKGRLLTDGYLSITDAEYQKPITAVHVGERLYLKVEDADQDRTPERDVVKVQLTTKRGEKETVELVETLAHSGVFTASVRLVTAEKPTPGNLKQADPEVECYFGDSIEIVYTDDRAASTSGPLTSSATVNVILGTDGKVQAFSKAYADENLAVETQFHIAESHFELFKSHKALERDEEARADLEAGRRVLREVMEDYPNPKYAPRVAYLFGQFAQELGQHAEAIQAYQLIVRQYPDHVLAPDAQFKLAQCFEEGNDFDQALEAYVTLAATYPKHPLIANVMVRISEHFWKTENFHVAAQVGEKFLEKFEGHKWGPKMGFRIGQCYFKDKDFTKAAAAFDRFVKQFPEDLLAPDALFWAGESFRSGNKTKDAFHRYNKCRWDFPASEAAKYARGRLALPEMLRQFDQEAAALEKESNTKEKK